MIDIYQCHLDQGIRTYRVLGGLLLLGVTYVPGSCRIVHETDRTMQNGLSPTDTIEIRDRIQNKETENAQKLENNLKEYRSHGQKPTKSQPTPIHKDESEHKQKVDTHLILNNKNILTEEAFTRIIHDYNTYGDSPITDGMSIQNKKGIPK
jgi:hypothetical protein